MSKAKKKRVQSAQRSFTSFPFSLPRCKLKKKKKGKHKILSIIFRLSAEASYQKALICGGGIKISSETLSGDKKQKGKLKSLDVAECVKTVFFFWLGY